MNNTKQPTLIVSLDFELFWGVQDCMSMKNYQSHILGARDAIPRMLALFQRHGIHATWAIVGCMFAKDEEELIEYLPDEEDRPSYVNSRLSSYNCIGLTDKSETIRKCFYAQDLIEEIAAVKGQEIGSHTFSHFYCREAGQTVAQFEMDMRAARKIAEAHGYRLTSAVFPKNQSTEECKAILKKLGFTAYRDEENDWIHKRIRNRTLLRGFRLADVYFPLTGQGGYIPRNENGIVNLAGSRMYKPFFKPLGFMEKWKLIRIKRQMLHAAKNGLTFHLWWHPHNVGVKTDFHISQLEEIFSYYDELKGKYGMRSLNMQEAAREIIVR